uniref:Uncharacterized protein n=1 Tax=Arundo donax TaxID=35708 RepID=A0A0A9GU22_ARUDO
MSPSTSRVCHQTSLSSAVAPTKHVSESVNSWKKDGCSPYL